MLVKLSWLLELRLRNNISGKIKVGFGPISGDETLGSRRYRIDPMVNYINRYDKKYVADIFFDKQDLYKSKFDIIVIVRNFDDFDEELIRYLKRKNTILIYGIADNPEGCKKSYLDATWLVRSMDGIILASPHQEKDIRRHGSYFRLIETPILNTRYKKEYQQKESVKLIWQGYKYNMKPMEKIHPIIDKLEKDTNYKINLIYNANISSKNEGIIQYVRWELSQWDNMLINADIGVVIKPLTSSYQQRKPPTKVLSYMAAGLPVVCTPSESDKRVIQHGKTGYFAYTNKDWYTYLRKLIKDPALRKKMGQAAREYVTKNFSVEKIVKKHIDFFDELMRQKAINKRDSFYPF